MKRITYIITVLLLVVSACEKPLDKGGFGNPLLKFFGDAKDDIGYSIAETTDGYILCGKLTIIERETNVAGSQVIVGEDPNFGLIKTNRMGIQQWSYNTGGEWFDEGRRVIVLGDGSFVCVGTTTADAAGTINTDVLVTKISATGTLIWENTYGNNFNQRGYDILHDVASDGFFVVGSNDDYTTGGTNDPGNDDMLMFTINSAGDLLETYSTGTKGNEYAKKVVFFDNKYYVIGETEGTHPYLPGDQKLNIMVFLADFNNFSGLDYKIYGTGEVEQVSDAISLGSELAIVGTVGEADSKEGLFVKIAPGTLEEEYDFSYFDLGSNVVEINSIAHLDGGGLLASGNTGGTALSGDMLFMFLDQNGNNLPSPDRYETGGTGLQSVNDAIVDSDGKIVAVGENRYENNSLITLIKFDPWE